VDNPGQVLQVMPWPCTRTWQPRSTRTCRRCRRMHAACRAS